MTTRTGGLAVSILGVLLATAPAAGAGTPPNRAVATFAGGCFWCMQPPFDKIDGVISTKVGYTGGTKTDPSYEEVSAGGTGHAEAIEVIFDPTRVRYQDLLEVFWHNIDPTAANRQFCDSGSQYRSAIFTHDEGQRRLAVSSRDRLAAAGTLPGPIVTEIVAAATFFPAEDYHQSYYRKNPIRYRYYRSGCGRDARLIELWGKAAKAHD